MQARTLFGVILICISTIAMRSVTADETTLPRLIVRWQEGLSITGQSPSALAALKTAEDRLGVAARPLSILATGSEVLELNRVLSQIELSDFVTALQNTGRVKHVDEDVRLQTMRPPRKGPRQFLRSQPVVLLTSGRGTFQKPANASKVHWSAHLPFC
jgi:hypothetical protein